MKRSCEDVRWEQPEMRIAFSNERPPECHWISGCTQAFPSLLTQATQVSAARTCQFSRINNTLLLKRPTTAAEAAISLKVLYPYFRIRCVTYIQEVKQCGRRQYKQGDRPSMHPGPLHMVIRETCVTCGNRRKPAVRWRWKYVHAPVAKD